MNQSQQKRDNFRLQIRTKHIQQMFRKIRKENKQRQVNNFTYFQPNLRQQTIKILADFIYNSLNYLCNQNYQKLMQQIYLLNQKVQVTSQVFSLAVNDYLKDQGGKFIDIVKKDISKEMIEDLPGLTRNTETLEDELNQNRKIKIVCQLMSISKNLQYQKFCLQSSILILKSIWNAIKSHYYQPQINSQLNHLTKQIFINICISLNKLMINNSNQVIRQHLKNMGFCSELTKMIQISSKYETSFHHHLLNLVKLYNINNPTQTSQEILNTIKVITPDNQHKEKYLNYCIFLLSSNTQQFYEPALQTMNNILKSNSDLINTNKQNFHEKLLNLVLHPNRNINNASLQLLSTIIFSSISYCDEFIQKYHIVDYLENRLILQKNQPTDQNTKNNIIKCTNIFCDFLLTKNTKLKRILSSHHIWQLIYQSFNQSDILFPTCIAFKFFFTTFNRKQRMKILPNFLQAVSMLPLQNNLILQIIQIKQTLLQIYKNSQQYQQQQQYQQIKKLFQYYQLTHYIENHQQQTYS